METNENNFNQNMVLNTENSTADDNNLNQEQNKSNTDTKEDVTTAEAPEMEYGGEYEDDEPEITSEYLRKNTSIGGWLKFFFVTMVIGAARTIISTVNELNTYDSSTFSWLSYGDFIVGIALAAFALYTIFAFVARKPNAVFLAKTYLIAIASTHLIVVFMYPYLLGESIGTLIVCTLWFLFLCNSDNVEEVIPYEYRKLSLKDYCIPVALGVVMIGSLVVPLYQIVHSNDMSSNFDEHISEELMSDASKVFNNNTISNEDLLGKVNINFKVPKGLKSREEEVDGGMLYTIENDEKTKIIRMISLYDTNNESEDFEGIWSAYHDEGYIDLDVIKEGDGRTAKGFPYKYRIAKYTYEDEMFVYRRFIILKDTNSLQVCAINSFDIGNDAYHAEFINSIDFNTNN